MSRKKKKREGRKQTCGGEPKKLKPGKEPRFASQNSQSDLADAQDNKRGNIGPSGQGEHRGRERSNRQTSASERPDVSSIGGDGKRQKHVK